MREGGNKSLQLALPYSGTWNTDCQIRFQLSYLSDLTDSRSKDIFTGPARELHTTYTGSMPEHSLLSHYEESGNTEQYAYVEYDTTGVAGPYS